MPIPNEGSIYGAHFYGAEAPDEWMLPSAGGDDPLWAGGLIVRGINTSAQMKEETVMLDGLPIAYVWGDRTLAVTVTADQLLRRGLADAYPGRVHPSSLAFISPMCGMSLAEIHASAAGIVLYTGCSKTHGGNELPQLSLSLIARGVRAASQTSALPVGWLVWGATAAPPRATLNKVFEWQIPLSGTVSSWVATVLPTGLQLEERAGGVWWVAGIPRGTPRIGDIVLQPMGPHNGLASQRWVVPVEYSRRRVLCVSLGYTPAGLSQVISMSLTDGDVVLTVGSTAGYAVGSRLRVDSVVSGTPVLDGSTVIREVINGTQIRISVPVLGTGVAMVEIIEEPRSNVECLSVPYGAAKQEPEDVMDLGNSLEPFLGSGGGQVTGSGNVNVLTDRWVWVSEAASLRRRIRGVVEPAKFFGRGWVKTFEHSTESRAGSIFSVPEMPGASQGAEYVMTPEHELWLWLPL